MVSRETKRRLFSILVRVLSAFGSVFYDRRYLRGRYFDDSFDGWRWVIRGILWQKILRFNSDIPWPVSPLNAISVPYNITFDPDDINMFNESGGKYFQNFLGSITIGSGTWIASNVGLITSNHDPCNLDRNLPGKDISIGAHCWIGMNSVVLPGVTLGEHTVVGAGSVVTKSFPEGYLVIAGNPARVIRYLPSAPEPAEPGCSDDHNKDV